MTCMNTSIRFNPDCLLAARFCSMLSQEKNVIAMSARPEASMVVFSASMFEIRKRRIGFMLFSTMRRASWGRMASSRIVFTEKQPF